MVEANKRTIDHVRDINNYIRKKVLEGKDISVEEDRDSIIKSFLEEITTDAGKMTPELFAFFLQKLNAHGLYETMDNVDFNIVYPTYVPFDVEAVAAKHGFKNLYAVLQNNLIRRSKNIEVKSASQIYSGDYGQSYFEKVASANPFAEEDIRNSDTGRHMSQKKELDSLMTREKAACYYWSFNNLEYMFDKSAYSKDPILRKRFQDIKNTPIKGSKDKQAGLSELNFMVGLLENL